MARPRLGSGGSAAVAMHLRAAGAAADPAEAAEWSLRAAREAGSLYAWDEAIEHAERPSRCSTETAAAREHAEAAVAAAHAAPRSRARGFPRGGGLLETALRRTVAGAATRRRPAWCTAGSAARCACTTRVIDIPRALEHFAAAERLLASRGGLPPAPGPRPGGDVRAAHRAAGRVLEPSRGDRHGRRAGATSRWSRGWAQGWAAVNQGRLADAAAIWERSWRTAHELADPYLGWMPVNAAALLSNAYLLDPPDGAVLVPAGAGPAPVHRASRTPTARWSTSSPGARRPGRDRRRPRGGGLLPQTRSPAGC